MIADRNRHGLTIVEMNDQPHVLSPTNAAWHRISIRFSSSTGTLCPADLGSSYLQDCCMRENASLATWNLRRSAEPIQVCSGKFGQSCYTIRRTILESGRQELAGDSI